MLTGWKLRFVAIYGKAAGADSADYLLKWDVRFKDWEELGLSNDFLFGKVMRKPELCKQMLETILGIEIERIEYPETKCQ